MCLRARAFLEYSILQSTDTFKNIFDFDFFLFEVKVTFSTHAVHFGVQTCYQCKSSFPFAYGFFSRFNLCGQFFSFFRCFLSLRMMTFYNFQFCSYSIYARFKQICLDNTTHGKFISFPQHSSFIFIVITHLPVASSSPNEISRGSLKIAKVIHSHINNDEMRKKYLDTKCCFLQCNTFSHYSLNRVGLAFLTTSFIPWFLFSVSFSNILKGLCN